MKETFKNTRMFGELGEFDFGEGKGKLKAVSSKCLELVLALAWEEDDE